MNQGVRSIVYPVKDIARAKTLFRTFAISPPAPPQRPNAAMKYASQHEHVTKRIPGHGERATGGHHDKAK